MSPLRPLLVLGRLIVATLALGVAEAPAVSPPARPLIVDEITLEGATRTSLDVVSRYLPLAAGDAVTPDQLLAAVDELRGSDLFAEVDFRTVRGDERGHLRLVLTAREHGPDVRFGTGFRDLDGWYLIPLQLRWDGLLGRGDRLRAQFGLGYRLAEVRLAFEEPRLGRDGRWSWGTELSSGAIDRRYFVDGIAYDHPIERTSFEAHLSRRLGEHWSIGVAGARQKIHADSLSTVAEDDDFRGVSAGDRIDAADVPLSASRHVGDVLGDVVRLDFVGDSRGEPGVALSPASGAWGRLRAETVLREDAHASRVELDLRTYRRVGAGVLALRGRAGAVEETAAFYDRFYLGGPYTVRGFLDESISPSEGDTRFWIASAEWRARLAGAPGRPRLVGSVFVDAGEGWTGGQRVAADDVAVSAGWGFRVRVPWIDSIGFDFGVPLTETPTRTSWAGHGALGWNF
ncbi:MAG: BamA/TamA family outer membrane protein [bacterium]